MSGILYIVSTPIGNPLDLTLRGRRILAEVDAVICEELRVGSTLLAQYELAKPLVELNEHSEAEQVALLVERLVRGENMALISDHGTPLLADPGAPLVDSALKAGIRITPIPGASSIVAALVVSGLPAARFRFLGQLPPKTELRQRALAQYKELAETLVLLEAPYRLMPVLKSIQQELGPERRMAVVCNLTMRDERIVRGTVAEVVQTFIEAPFKGEFVLVIEGQQRS
ncbi:MAG: 16S rRNA (cytidine(1402)-2'-O)-methyltransferase [Anaerolineae bacterium]